MYYLGLKATIDAIGWCVTDKDYEILSKSTHKGKRLFGTLKFEAAETAEKRRLYRGSRRTIERRNERCRILRELIGPAVLEKDPEFFKRLEESSYYKEDKLDTNGINTNIPYSVFADANYTDKSYYRNFPTIFHLRKYLMETDETPDIRLVYLALHSFMQHRGHFYLNGNIESVRDFNSCFDALNAAFCEEFEDFHLDLTKGQREKTKDILRDRSMSAAAKKAVLIKDLGASSKQEKAFITLFCGLKVKLSELFAKEELEEKEGNSFEFRKGYEAIEPYVLATAGDRFYLIELAKKVYDWSLLDAILGDCNSISEAEIERFEKHKKELATLKKLVKDELGEDDYRMLFSITEKDVDNYVAYTGKLLYKKNEKKITLQHKCGKDAFYKFLKPYVEKLSENHEDISREILESMERGDYLPKQRCSDNSVIPHQVHLVELERILSSMAPKHPIIAEQANKIRQTFLFVIPYYVGPLAGVVKDGKSTNWAVRKVTGEKIYPWNFEDIIDTEESAVKFIERMTGKCTYLPKEDVLPKNSLLYARFEVLNELNCVRLDGEPLSVSVKQEIYSDLFMKNKKVTKAMVVKYLTGKGIANKSSVLSGLNGDFKSSLTAWNDIEMRLPNNSLTNEQKEIIITCATVLGEDRNMMRKRLSKTLPELTDNEVEALSGISYKGWGKLSRKFLSEITSPDENGEAKTIIRLMWETNQNLMQILSHKYRFTESIADENVHDVVQNCMTYSYVKSLYAAPYIKKTIWKTLQLVDEISRIMGEKPTKIFVEMQRENEERRPQRKKYLRDAYKDLRAYLKKLKINDKELLSQLEKVSTELETISEETLRSDKIFLYFMQLGRCMYSGEIINLNDLINEKTDEGRIYNIDHIFPKSLTSDDRFQNKVLVLKSVNEEKNDLYPVPDFIQERMMDFWNLLRDAGILMEKKYERLVRKTGFDALELASFIEADVTEVRKANKIIADVIKQALPDTDVVYVKASNVSKFRQKYEMRRTEQMNDFCFAHDAYLNIVVGNVYYTKFTSSPLNFVTHEMDKKKKYSLNKIFAHDVRRGGYVAWEAGDEGTISKVRKNIRRRPIVNNATYQRKGQLFDDTLAKKGQGQIPQKENPRKTIEKYGGRNKIKNSYFALVESTIKNKRVRSLEAIPIIVAKKNADLKKYLEEKGLVDVDIRIPIIPINSTIIINGYELTISGVTGNDVIYRNAHQLLLNNEEQAILKKVIRFNERRKIFRESRINEADNLSNEDLIKLYEVFQNLIDNTIYAQEYSVVSKHLSKGKNTFIEMTIENKCVLLAEVLKTFQCNAAFPNLKLIGAGATGVIHKSKKLEPGTDYILKRRSISGFYEEEINLLTE